MKFFAIFVLVAMFVISMVVSQPLNGAGLVHENHDGAHKANCGRGRRRTTPVPVTTARAINRTPVRASTSAPIRASTSAPTSARTSAPAPTTVAPTTTP